VIVRRYHNRRFDEFESLFHPLKRLPIRAHGSGSLTLSSIRPGWLRIEKPILPKGSRREESPKKGERPRVSGVGLCLRAYYAVRR